MTEFLGIVTVERAERRVTKVFLTQLSQKTIQ